MENKKFQISLLLCLSEDNIIVEAKVTENPHEDCFNFVTDRLHRVNLESEDHDDLFLVIDFKNRNDLPEIDTKFSRFDLAQLLNEHFGRETIKILPLPLYFPRECGVSRENLFAPEYRNSIVYDIEFHYPSIYGNTHNFRGIHTDCGLHLFSQDALGNFAAGKCLQYYSNHFFDKQRETGRLDIVIARIIDGDPEFTGNKFSSLEDWSVQPLDLSPSWFHQNKATIEIVESTFNMLPTIDNFYQLLSSNGIKELSPSERLYDYTSLIRLQEETCARPEELKPEFHQVFTFEDRFYDLTDELDDCDNAVERAEVGQRIRDRAAEIMEKEFPDLHFCRDPKVIEAELQQTQQIEEPMQNTYKGPKL